MILDASAGGSLKNRDETEARELVESMAQNEYRATNDRGAKKKGGVLELDTQTALLAQQKLMTSQMEAMMKMLSNPQVQTSPIGGFGGNTHDNSKNETCNGITLRSREIPERPAVEKPLKKKVNEGEVENKQEVVVENERYEGEVENENMSKEVEISEDEKEKVEKQREIKERESKKVEKVEALEQMPSYAKFLKELLTKKRKPLDDEMVSMTEECSALIQRKLPQKKKDPGSFTIPCSIGTLTIEKALCDLGASINLMPLSMMKKIPRAVAKPTKMSLSLADRSVVHPEGILHDVLVKVAGFVFPADFVVLDIEETREWEPLLLGRPFLATSRALIDVEMGELMLRTDDQQVTFNVFDKMECDDGDPQWRTAATMEDEQVPPVPQPPRRTLGDYGRRDNDALANQGFQPANPVSFDIKNTVLSALKENPYSGSEAQCPNLHLSHFYEACDYTDPPGVSESDKRLRLFKHSLTGRAKDWLDMIPAGTIETWRQLERKFLDRYFPIHKFLERRAEISNFEQADGETLYDAWERFKVCLKRCPNHGFDGHNQMQMFTQGLRAQTRMILDASAGGSLKNRDETEARELVESMAQNEYRATNDRGAKKKGGVLELDTQTALLAQQKLMTSQMEAMMKLLSNPQVQTSPIGGFGGNTHDNPKNETCNGITLRSREIPERPAMEKPLKKKMLTRLTGKGKKKSDANPPQEPPKKPRTKMSASKGQSSRSAQASPPRRSNVTRPQVHPHFISEVHEKRYTKIQTFTINQEKGFGEDLLKGVAELGNEVKSRKWGKFNKLMIKDEANPGNQMWVREFLANAYLPDQSSVPEFYSTVRGIRVYYSADHINTLLGCRVRGACELVTEKERISNVALRLSLTSFNPIHRAWGEFWLKNVRVVGNNSEIQIDNVAAVRLLADGRYIDLGLWLQKDLHEMANNNNPTFTLGHCNLIAALCRASNVPMCVQEGDLHPVRPLALSYFEKRFERGPIVPRGEGNAAREEALREEEEINRFEEGNHPDQQGDPANEYQDIPAQDPPRYSHDMNQLASMLHQMEISQYSGLPNLYFDTASSMYTEAMTYRSTFPPPTFGTLYPVDTDWEAHQARELNSFQARQAYNSGLRTSELAEIERRRRVEQDEAAAMEREMLDVDGLNLNLNSPFTNYFTGQPDDAV
ncbi:unnamed protein product [Trifolium pratense]|uniref:Uncharacterized protein n=1 Tax=Trifolium pratense TaxID=57577 RepID=A0ACB0JFN5_TRIPR|nr:unnamed protein product [Trifolium pratense]